MIDYRITQKLQKIISLSEEEVVCNNYEVLYPIDLFIALLKERTGTLGELYLKLKVDLSVFYNVSAELSRKDNDITHDLFSCKVSTELVEVFDKAVSVMNRYGQVFLNEGHVIKAMFSLDNEVVKLFNENEKRLILDIATKSRDLIVPLKSYNKEFEPNSKYIVKRAEQSDLEEINRFILEEFNQDWATNVKRGFAKEEVPVFVAKEDNRIIGFGAYDVISRGLFGPMGVMREARTNQVGHSILYNCLKDMKMKGYKYAIIAEAGPIEFYEKACGAVIIYRSDV